MKRYRMTITFMTGLLKGLTIEQYTNVYMAVGETYTGSLTGTVYRVDKVTEI